MAKATVQEKRSHIKWSPRHFKDQDSNSVPRVSRLTWRLGTRYHVKNKCIVITTVLLFLLIKIYFNLSFSFIKKTKTTKQNKKTRTKPRKLCNYPGHKPKIWIQIILVFNWVCLDKSLPMQDYLEEVSFIEIIIFLSILFPYCQSMLFISAYD